MKKLLAILTILIATTAMSFSQKMLNGVEFYLYIDDVQSSEFDVYFNPDGSTAYAGELIITFDSYVTGVTIHEGSVMVANNGLTFYSADGDTGAVYMIKIRYMAFISGGDFTIFASYSTYVSPEFTAYDTLLAYNNGVASVPSCTVTQDDVDAAYTTGYDNGFDNGVASVVCDFDETDTITAWNNGFGIGLSNGADVDVDSIATVNYNDGFDNGFDVGFDNGADLTVNADDYQAGWEAAKETCGTSGISITSADMGVSVYPNPVNNGGVVTIDCPNFYKVVILTITGQVIDTYSTTEVSTTGLDNGVYFFNIFDTDENAYVSKVLVR